MQPQPGPLQWRDAVGVYSCHPLRFERLLQLGGEKRRVRKPPLKSKKVYTAPCRRSRTKALCKMSGLKKFLKSTLSFWAKRSHTEGGCASGANPVCSVVHLRRTD